MTAPDYELIAPMLEEYATSISGGEIDGFGRYSPEAMLEQAAALRAAANAHEARTVILTNPHNGEPRDYRDVNSDPAGVLCVKPGEPLRPAGGAVRDAIKLLRDLQSHIGPRRPEGDDDCDGFTWDEIDRVCAALAAQPDSIDSVIARLSADDPAFAAEIEAARKRRAAGGGMKIAAQPGAGDGFRDALSKLVSAAGLMLSEIDSCGHEVDPGYRAMLHDAWTEGSASLNNPNTSTSWPGLLPPGWTVDAVEDNNNLYVLNTPTGLSWIVEPHERIHVLLAALLTAAQQGGGS